MSNKISDLRPVKIDRIEAIIPAGDSVSSETSLGAGTLVGIEMPQDWDAANLSFQASSNGQDYTDYFDKAGSEYEIEADAARTIKLNPQETICIKFIKVRSGLSTAPVNQSSERAVVLLVRVFE